MGARSNPARMSAASGTWERSRPGIGIIWRRVRISYVQTWQTDEFCGRKGGWLSFGSLAVSARL